MILLARSVSVARRDMAAMAKAALPCSIGIRCTARERRSADESAAIMTSPGSRQASSGSIRTPGVATPTGPRQSPSCAFCRRAGWRARCSARNHMFRRLQNRRWHQDQAMRVLLILTWLMNPAVAVGQYPFGYGSPYNDPPSGWPWPLPSQPKSNSASRDSLAREMLYAHNAVRALVGDPPLSWSPRLAAAAQDWAQRLISADSFMHRPRDPYGENLYTISGGAATPWQVVQSWAAEVQSYDVRSDTCSSVCGHYTQIVWRATRSLGCAVAGDPERAVWVCEYDPPGNIVGDRPY
jgi:pathogenesis-related protein 1